MKTYIFILIIAGFWIIGGCNKVDLPPDGEPVFSIKGSLEDKQFDWQAGLDNRYMLADFMTTENNRLVYRANLGEQNSASANTGEQLVVMFVQSEDDSAVVDVNNSIKASEYEFATGSNHGGISAVSKLSYTTTITGLPSFDLSFSMNNLQLGELPIEGVINDIDSNYVGHATMTLIDTLQRVSTQKVWIDFKSGTISGVYIVADPPLLTAHVFGGKAINFNWGNGLTTDSTFIIDSTNFEQKHTIEVQLNNDQYVMNSIDFSIKPDKPCNVRMNLFPFTTIDTVYSILPNYENGRVIVQYITPDGQLFSSDFAKQDSDSYFRINTVEEYEINELGNPTKKLDVDFNCTLMNEDRTLIKTLSNVKGIIAIGYPR